MVVFSIGVFRFRASKVKGTMLKRNTVWFVGLLLGLMASHTLGLGLGSVTVESYLNQPLRLRIEILQLGETRIEDVTVQMASTDDFARFGIERVGVLSNVRLRVEESADGAYVFLTSNTFISEPYLSFILETRWPSGRLLSEHTVLLDLPVYREESARAESSLRQPISTVLRAPENNATRTGSLFAAPSRQTSAPQIQASDSADNSNVAEASEEANSILADAEPERTALSERNTIETDASSTLIGIARQIRPDESVSLQQTMIAIQTLNPNAFADGNINRLLTGQILRLPTEQEIRSVDAAEAIAEVGRQNQEMADAEPFGLPGQTDSGQNRPSGRLSVIAAVSDAIDASSTTASSASEENAELDRRIAELENELSVRQEEADRARVDRENLGFRLADLDAQIEAAQELIRLQDIQLAQLRESLALAEAAAEAAAAEQAAQEATLASDAQTAAASTSSSGLLAVLANNSIVLFGGLGFFVLLLVWVMLRRNRAASLKDSGVLEPLVEMQAEQLRAEAGDGSSASANESGSADGASELEDHKEAQLNEELNEIMSASGDSSDADHDGKTDAPSVDTETPADDDTDSFLDDLGIDLDDFDSSIFDLDDDDDSTASGQSGTHKGKVSSDDLEMTFDLSDPGSPDIDEKEPASEVVQSVDASDIPEQTEAPEKDELEQFQFTPTDADESVPEQAANTDEEEGGNSAQEAASIDAEHDVSGMQSEEEVELDDLDFFSEEEARAQDDEDSGADESDDEVSILSDDDETATKLELAYAYQKMGDADGAMEILQEVISEGNEGQIAEARELLDALREKP
jgi:pilus assembly protein FimV